MPEMKKVLVRLAYLTDMPQLLKLQYRAGQTMIAGQYGPEEMEYFLQHIGAVDVRMVAEGRFYVAEIDDRIVGCGGWWPTERRPEVHRLGGLSAEPGAMVERTATVRALYVDPSERHHGVAQRIAEAIRRAARSQNIYRFEVLSPLPSEGFFIELGYRSVEQFNMTLPQGLEIPLVHMTMREHDTGRVPVSGTFYGQAAF